MANLTLDFSNAQDAPIRISFQQKGSWSTIGTTCKQISDRTRPTMNFGWLTPSTADQEVHRVVLHEFGHAMGLIHEHQNPAGGIKWNKPEVIRELSGPPNNWTPQQIDLNMFQPYDKNETNYTQTDGKSIMMYSIPANWTLDGFTVGLNTELSPTDKQFIAQQYP
jgi:serralysin